MKRILKELELSHIAAVDKPCQEHALVTIMKRDFSTEERKEATKAGAALPGGRYPIYSGKDVENAVKDYGRTGSSPAVKAHIIRRARAVGATNSLPDGWVGKMDVPERIAKRLLGLDDSGIETFTKAVEDVRENIALCDNGAELVTKFDELPITEIIVDEQLTDLGKHDELYEMLDQFLVKETGFIEQLEKTLDEGDKIAKLTKRIDGLLTKWDDSARQASIEARQAKAGKKPDRAKDPGAWHSHNIARQTLRMHPAVAAVMGGPTPEEAEHILRNKFGYGDKAIASLKGPPRTTKRLPDPRKGKTHTTSPLSRGLSNTFSEPNRTLKALQDRVAKAKDALGHGSNGRGGLQSWAKEYDMMMQAKGKYADRKTWNRAYAGKEPGPFKKQKPKLGSGKRFDQLESKFSHRKGIKDPAALAASIGNKKYGSKRMHRWAAHNR